VIGELPQPVGQEDGLGQLVERVTAAGGGPDLRQQVVEADGLRGSDASTIR